MKMCWPVLSATCWIFVSITVKEFYLWSELKWLSIVRNPDKNVDFCQYRNDVRPVMVTFLVMARLTSFYIYNSTCIIIQSAYVHVWSTEK